MTDFSGPPGAPMPGLGSTPLESERISQGIRAEQRAYMEEVEQTVAEMAAASTTLEMRLLQLGNRGYQVDVEVSDRQVRGRVSHVSGEVFTIETQGGAAFTMHTSAVRSIRFADVPGETRAVNTGEPGTVIAKLRELWMLAERCTVGRLEGAAVLGDIKAVTDGHVELTDPQGINWLIPMDTIGWVGPKL